MGEGTIISGGTDGIYVVEVNYSRDTIAAQVAALETRKAGYDAKLPTLPPGKERNMMQAQSLGVEKRINHLDRAPEDYNINAHCADLTEDLTGTVGLIEVPGQTQAFNIHPGYDGAGTYALDRDGFIMPTVGLTSAQAYANLGILPAWQKWKPTFRYGTITALNGDICSVDLEAATSTQRGLDVNQGVTLSAVPIEYMDCDGAAFVEGDTVLIKFEGQEWSTPKVIGFKDNPQPCGGEYLVLKMYSAWYPIDEYMVYDLSTGDVAEGIPKDGQGAIVTFPCSPEEISYWLATKDKIAGSYGGTRVKSDIIDDNVYPIEGSITLTENLPCSTESFYNLKSGTRTQAGGQIVASGVHDFEMVAGMCINFTYGAIPLTGTDSTANLSSRVGTYGFTIENRYDYIRNLFLKTPTGGQSLIEGYSSGYIKGAKADAYNAPYIVEGCSVDTYMPRTEYPGVFMCAMKSTNFYMVSAYSSVGVRGAELVNGCFTRFIGTFPETREVLLPWVSGLRVDLVYNPEGLGAGFDPKTVAENPLGAKVREYIDSVYEQFKVNGFPEDHFLGPYGFLNVTGEIRE